jgi:hypothetical protein
MLTLGRRTAQYHGEWHLPNGAIDIRYVTGEVDEWPRFPTIGHDVLMMQPQRLSSLDAPLEQPTLPSSGFQRWRRRPR